MREPTRIARPQRPTGGEEDVSVKVNPFRKPRWPVAYSFTLVTFVLFLGSWAAQFGFQLAEVRADAAAHNQVFEWSAFWVRYLAATFENWQSEALQLCWQAAGLALLYHWGSSQSRESEARIEAKVDALLAERGVTPPAE